MYMNRHDKSAAAILMAIALCGLLGFAAAAPAQEAGGDLMQAAKEMFNAGDYDSAQELLRLSLSKEDPGGVRYAVCLQNLALLEYLNFHFLESEQLYLKAIAITESVFGKESMPVANNLYGLSRCLRRSNRLLEAENCLSRLLEIRSKQLGSQHRLVSNTLFDMAVNYDRQGKYEQAGPFYAKALDLREKEHGKNSAALKQLLEDYAHCLHRLHDDSKASQVEERLRDLTPNQQVQQPPPPQDDGSRWQSTIYSQP